ncbi:MAG TPA: hypothetical protein VL371_24890 [Gemmataceae bacterium]|jgi:hypothetical protein|nr:hypothetical protein [Gemmataceae bacterium]
MQRFPWHAWAGLFLLTAENCRAADFADLLRRVPAQANAVLLVDADAVHRSPMGTKTQERDSLTGVDSLPAAVDKLVIGAQISLTTLDPAWRVGVASTRAAMTPAQLAAAEGGTTDELGGRQVVISPRNTYYAMLAPQTVGAMHPANRQEFARWLRSTGGLSPYLAEATAKATAPVFLALDLTDVFDPPGLRAKLATSKVIAGHEAQLDAIVRAIAGLKGVRLAVQVAPTLRGEIMLDGDVVSALTPVAKTLVLTALDASGNAVEDLEAWTVQSSGASVVLSGPLTERGLRQLVSELLTPAVTATVQATPSKATPGKPSVEASQKYFRSVSKLLNELQKQKQQTYNNLARAYQNYARQIDELPLLGVDPDLLTYGAQVAVTLRGLATLGKATLSQGQMLSMQRADAAVQTSGSTPYGNGYWGYGYAPTTQTENVSNAPQINSLIAQAGANERVIRQQTWANIDKETADIRRKMVAKYQVEF